MERLTRISHYKELAALLAQRMDSGKWPVGKPIPSCRELVREFATSLKTVQLALNVLKAEGRLRTSQGKPSYVALGAPLSRILENTVALVLPHSIQDATSNPVYQGVIERVGQTHWTLLTLHTAIWRREFPVGLRELPVRGILLMGPCSSEMLHRYESLGRPVVVLDQPAQDCQVHAVAVDNFKAAFEATTRLLKLGHRRLAFVRTLVSSLKALNPNALEREKGFVAACQKHLGESAQYKIFSAWESAAVAMDILHARPRFTAVLTTSCTHAAQLEQAAHQAGMNVPRDLSVVTFQDTAPQMRDWSGPQIDFKRIGSRAVELLERNKPGLQQIRVPAIWHAGDSLGLPIQ